MGKSSCSTKTSTFTTETQKPPPTVERDGSDSTNFLSRSEVDYIKRAAREQSRIFNELTPGAVRRLEESQGEDRKKKE